MRKFPVIAIVAALLGASSAIADDQGATAILRDTITPQTGTSADFFVVSKIDGESVSNADEITTRADAGKGFVMNPQNDSRRIPAQTTTVEIIGSRHYAAPVLELLHGSRVVSGTETFTPLPDHSYEIKGLLEDDDCAVWIEDTATATVVGQKFQNKC